MTGSSGDVGGGWPQRRPDEAELRVSDAERHQVAEVLRHAAGEGRLDIEELEQRLEAAFGFAWSEGESSPVQAGSAQCVWSDADPAMPAKVVSLAVGNDDTFEAAFHQSAKQLYESTKALLTADVILEDDLGLGDDSYRTKGGIYVLDGDTYYSFSTIGGESDEAVAGLKAMATAVVGG
jgi:hypothetical protein